jgi:hypothetical protein
MANTEIQLTQPINAYNEEVSVLKIREPNVGDLKAMDGVTGDIAKVCKLIERLASIPASSVEAISASDFTNKIAPVVAGFLGDSLPTGGTSTAP